MKLNDLELNEEYEETDSTDLSDQQIAQIVHHMDELIVDQRADNPTEAAHEALDQIAGFEQGIVEPHVRIRLLAHLVDLYGRMYGSV